MFSHGIIAGLLFAVVGRMVYDRTHTRELDELWRECILSRAMPFAAVTFVIAGCRLDGHCRASAGSWRNSILIGAWKAFPLAV